MKILLVLLLLSSFADASSRVLIFGKTLRPAHAQIIPGAMEGLALFLTAHGLTITCSQESELKLSEVDALVLVDVSEGIFSETMKLNIQEAVEKGMGLVLIHASISAGKDWPWLKERLGSLFLDHPPIQLASVFGPSGTSWSQTDEWYNFTDPLSQKQTVWALVDESSYAGGKMGPSHPISWSFEEGQTRLWYTGMGHAESLYQDEGSPFLSHVLEGLEWSVR